MGALSTTLYRGAMTEHAPFLISTLIAFAVFWTMGGPAVRKLVVAMEGSAEFGHGTTSRLRRLKGYGTFATWMLLAVMAASFFADWGVHGDLSAATERFMDRLEVTTYILEAMGDD